MRDKYSEQDVKTWAGYYLQVKNVHLVGKKFGVPPTTVCRRIKKSLGSLPVRYDIVDLKTVAKQKGGDCLSERYIGTKGKYLWVCAKSHRWDAPWCEVQRGSWCRDCVHEGLRHPRISIDVLQTEASARGGKLLSLVFTGALNNHTWECSSGHSWEASWSNIKRGSWCPDCALLNRPPPRKTNGLFWLQKLAWDRGGILLTREYRGCHEKHSWICGAGHRWDASGNSIQQGGWCPDCAEIADSIAQREVFEFCKVICPDAEYEGRRLLNNKKMKLDVWVPSLRKAVELDGEYWHDTPKRKESDARKDALCREAGIQLLRIKYLAHWFRKKRPVGEALIRDFLQAPGTQDNLQSSISDN